MIESNSLPGSIPKPKIRSDIRRKLGRKYFILKRKLQWLRKSNVFAREIDPILKEFEHFRHQSLLLRPLKGVEMQYQHNKIVNLNLAIRKIDRIVIKPGETFSFWYLVGNPTRRKGYKKGLVLHQGTITYDYGGGLCQLGNLLYWMVLHSPLTVTERWRHGYDVFPDINRKLPFGSGATLSYNYVDFQFKNDTELDFQIRLTTDQTHLTGMLLANKKPIHRFEVYEAAHLIRQEYWGGYLRHNRINRKTFEIESSQPVKDELITENHAIMMYNPLLEKENPA